MGVTGWARRPLLGALAALLTAWPAAAAEPSAAERFIQVLGDRTVAALNRSGQDRDARVAAMREVLNASVDLPAVGRIVLGRHWRAASEAQRRDYLQLFEALTLGILAQRFSEYTGSERFVIGGGRPAGGEDVMVGSQIRYTDYPPLNIDWRVRRPEAERPVIVDIVVEGVSLILTNRSDIDAIVGRQGMDGLLRELRARLDRIERGGTGAPGAG